MTTQEKIINVATQEFLNSGYLGASLRKIAKAAHVTTGAMYGYIKIKRHFLMILLKKCLRNLKMIIWLRELILRRLITFIKILKFLN